MTFDSCDKLTSIDEPKMNPRCLSLQKPNQIFNTKETIIINLNNIDLWIFSNKKSHTHCNDEKVWNKM